MMNEKVNMKPIQVGVKIEWTSAAGVLTGTVDSIRLALNAAQEMCAWIIVSKIKNLTENETYKDDYRVQLNGTDGNMKMLKFAIV